MRKHISKLLQLPGLWVDSWEINNQEIKVKVRSPRVTAMCPDCGKSSKKVHQYHERRIKHSIWQSRAVILLLARRRFYCRTCHKPFSEWLPGIDRRRSTGNFRNILLENMSHQSFHQVMISDRTSSSVLYDVLAEHQKHAQAINWAEQGTNLTLGIDEHSYRGRRMALTITNITERRLLAVGVDASLATVRQYLEMADKSKVSEVCMDMKAGYLNIVSELLPRAQVTVDKFHVVATANQMIDEVRRVIAGNRRGLKLLLVKGKENLTLEEQQKLIKLFEKYQAFPSLYQAYFVKEQVREFYRLKDRPAAAKKFQDLVMFCQTSHSRYVQDFGKTLKRWQEYILNYFNRYSTNAFTEGVHTKIKMLKRLSFGFRNIHHYIAKVTLAFMPFLFLNHHTI